MRIIILLLCAFLGIQAEVDPNNAQLKEPICDIEIASPEDKTKFAEFAKQEECLFQRFMDKRQEIDCIIQKNDVLNCDDGCMEEITRIGDEIYARRIEDDVRCVCVNPRNASMTYEAEDVQEIGTLDEYIDCWIKLWKTMRGEVDKILNDVQSESDTNIKEKCKEKYGDKHVFRCKD